MFRIIKPEWDFIPNVCVFTTLRKDLNNNEISFSGNHEDAKSLLHNFVKVESNITWLKQVHGKKIVDLPLDVTGVEADGAFTKNKRTPCIVRTADCLPIVFAKKDGSEVGIVHAGWRGLHANIISEMAGRFSSKDDVYIWLGPAIGQLSYEVGSDVYSSFININDKYNVAFKPSRKEHYYFDLYQVAQMQLLSQGFIAENITGGTFDTFSNSDFHSHRRDGENSGRMATVIYIV